MRIPRRLRAAPSRTIDGSAVVIQTVLGEVSMLNDVATLVWQSIDGARDEAALAKLVVNEFDVDDATALQDVIELVDELAGAKLVEIT